MGSGEKARSGERALWPGCGQTLECRRRGHRGGRRFKTHFRYGQNPVGMDEEGWGGGGEGGFIRP